MTEVREAAARKIIYARSGGVCEICGRRAESIQHRTNRSQGGTWAPSNLLHLCGSGGEGRSRCHGWLTVSPTYARALGLGSLPAGCDPADWPMYVRPSMFPRGWWRADDLGMWIPALPPDPEPLAAIQALAAVRFLEL